MLTHHRWRRSFWTGNLKRGNDVFWTKPDGRAGLIYYKDRSGTFEMPYEYGVKDAFVVFPDNLIRVDSRAHGVRHERQMEIANLFRDAIRDVYDRDVLVYTAIKYP